MILVRWLLMLVLFWTEIVWAEAERELASLQRDAKTEREVPEEEDLSVSGIIEVEATHHRDFNKDESSDLVNATVQLDVEKKLNSHSAGRITLLHEDEASPDNKQILVDEAVLSLFYSNGLYLNAGKMYLPFGTFRSEFISDPLTLELGETNENALVVGWAQAGFDISAFTFNGDVQRQTDKDKINSFGANLSYQYENDGRQLQVSSQYISNIADSDALGSVDVLTDSNSNSVTDDMHSIPAAVGFSLDFENSYSLLHLEYVSTLNKFNAQDLAWNGRDARLSAQKYEVGFKYNAFQIDTLFLIGFQSSENSLALNLPKERLLVGSKWMFSETLQLSYEYKHDKDFRSVSCSNSNCGTGGEAHMHSVQLSLGF